jgi:hypothetical protein
MVQWCFVLAYGVVAFGVEVLVLVYGAKVLVYGVVAFVWRRGNCFDCEFVIVVMKFELDGWGCWYLV